MDRNAFAAANSEGLQGRVSACSPDFDRFLEDFGLVGIEPLRLGHYIRRSMACVPLWAEDLVSDTSRFYLYPLERWRHFGHKQSSKDRRTGSPIETNEHPLTSKTFVHRFLNVPRQC